MNADVIKNKVSPRKNLGIADEMIRAGRFNDAEAVCRTILRKDPGYSRSYIRLGFVYLLENRLDEAQRWLENSLECGHKRRIARELLAEVHYRRGDFEQAARLHCANGRRAVSAKLDSFKGLVPYETEGGAASVNLKFVLTDPLPVVRMRVNESEPVNLLIDTGGGELILDTDFAREIGIRKFGRESNRFGGGKRGVFEHGRAASCDLGELTVRNVPVNVMNVRRFSDAIFGGLKLDGILGTVFLYHFIPTLDYPESQLILRRLTPQNQEQVELEAHEPGSLTIPFWMADDHIMVAWGTVNCGRPMLMCVDTGLAGGGFSCPKSTLKTAGIELQRELRGNGLGGGGKFGFVPFVVDRLSLGDAVEHNVQGFFLGKFPIEYECGFRIGGMVSHKFFRNYAFTMDFARMRYVLRRHL